MATRRNSKLGVHALGATGHREKIMDGVLTSIGHEMLRVRDPKTGRDKDTSGNQARSKRRAY